MKNTDISFDQQMISQLAGIPTPEDEIRRINPWSKPIGFIIWGLILTTIHLNFLYLQYIFPTIGVILIFLGFRSLRNENKYFTVLWLFSIVRLILQITDLVVTTTPLNLVDYPEVTIGAVMLAFQITMFLLFHKALQKVYQKANKFPVASPLLWVSLWTGASFLIAILPLSHSWLVFIPMIVFYIMIVRQLFQIGEQLDDIGYILVNTPARISSKAFGWVYFLLAFAIVVGCSIHSNHLRLEPEIFQPPGITDARQRLLDMEFPAEALQYLSEDDVAMLRDAINIEVFDKSLMFDPKRIEHKEYGEYSVYITHTYEPGNKNLGVSTIYIQMPENQIYVMQYFKWIGGNPIWQDGIAIYGENKEFVGNDKEIISNALFYRQKEIKYTADFPRLTCDEVQVNSMFGAYYAAPIMAALSYPFGAKDQGGYILYHYTVGAESDMYITYSTFNYIHHLSPLRIPYAKTEEQILNGAYMILDELNQHHTNYESIKYKEMK